MKVKTVIKDLKLDKGLTIERKFRLFDILALELSNIYNSYGVPDSSKHFTKSINQLKVYWKTFTDKVPSLSDSDWKEFTTNFVEPLFKRLCKSKVAETKRHKQCK